MVYKGATLLMGCEPKYTPCTDDPNAATGGKLRVRDTVGGSLLASWARGVDVYDSHIKGSVRQVYGGGGLSCAVPTAGVFSSLHARVSSAYEDDTIGGRPQDHRSADLLVRCPPQQGAGQSLLHNARTLADGDGSQVVSNVVRSGSALHRGQTRRPVRRFGRAAQPGQARIRSVRLQALPAQPGPRRTGHGHLRAKDLIGFGAATCNCFPWSGARSRRNRHHR